MFNFDLGAPGTTGSGVNDLIADTGSLTLAGTLNITALTGFAPGMYTLMTYAGGAGGTLTVGTTPNSNYNYIVTSSGGQVCLAVQGTWTWSGGGSNGYWSNTGNWSSATLPANTANVHINGWSGGSNLNMTLDSSYTIANLFIEGWLDGTNAISCTSGNSYTLTLTGNLTFNDSDMNTWNGVTCSAVVNVGGQLLGISDVNGPTVGRGDFPDEISNPLYFTANGNTIGGGIVDNWESFHFSGNNNTFDGGITVSGFNAYGWHDQAYVSAGCVAIGGTGNTFGAGAINLNQFGSVILTTAQNLANITAINFSGGNLEMTTPMTALPSGMTAWNVTSGQLIVANNTGVLGGLGVNLGGANSFGSVVGCQLVWLGPGPAGITGAVTLSGKGGILDSDVLDFGSGGIGTLDYNYLDVSGPISGSGMLIKSGMGWTDLLESSANTYSGGTVVLSGMMAVGANTSMGTGNVTVTGAGWLSLTSAGNVASGASVLVQKLGNFAFNFDAYVWTDSRLYARLDLQTDMMPTIAPASNGVIWLDCNAAAGGPIATALGRRRPRQRHDVPGRRPIRRQLLRRRDGPGHKQHVSLRLRDERHWPLQHVPGRQRQRACGRQRT